uniref:NADH dehydrogenase subunit 6 n=1 Tax=Oncicola luehei TaxID=1100885 RepID=H2E2D5_9BILA|nr:NADH dehydrogenase subunit 6 [Oncicola luehei]AER42894.1 NADH dehydrogenase subunit 6 [Oncicola luehei]
MVMEVILVASLSVVRIMGVVPVLSVGLMVMLVGFILSMGVVASYWIQLVLGVVYIGGISALLVYVGGYGLFVKGVSWGAVCLSFSFIFMLVYLGDSVLACSSGMLESFEMGFSGAMMVFMGVVLVVVLFLTYSMLSGMGGMMRV